MSVTPISPLQQTLQDFEAVLASREAKEITDSYGVAARLQDIFREASPESDSAKLCQALRSKRFVFLYDSSTVRFGHAFWRFISSPFCKYIDVQKFSPLLQILQSKVESAQASVEQKAETTGKRGAVSIQQGQPDIKSQQIIEKNFADLQETNKKLADRLDAAEKGKKELEGKNKELQAQITFITSSQSDVKIAGLTAQVKSLTSEKEKNQKQITELKKELDEAQKTQKSTQKKPPKLPKIQKKLETENLELQETVEILAGRLQESQTQIQKLAETLAERNQEVMKTVGKAEASKDEYRKASYHLVKTLQDDLRIAFSPIKRFLGFGGQERFSESTTRPSSLPKGMWLFLETYDKETGRESISYSNGTETVKWDPDATSVQELVQNVTGAAQGIIWVKETPHV